MNTPPNAPEYGTGPVNFAGDAGASPFDSFGNTINYQNMMRYQMVTQYQQSQTTPYNLSAEMQRKVATDPRYSYGVNNGQSDIASYYNRQASLNKTAYNVALASGVTNMVAWGSMSTPLAAVGFAGTTALLAPLALSMPIGAMIAKKSNDILTRQKYMHSLAIDLEMNRNKIGMPGMSFDEATAGGRTLADIALGDQDKKQAGFFNADQIMRIQKIGISSGLLTASGARSGTMQQFAKNAKDLISTTEEIVKTLKTTIEGSMSIIKEMNQIGFTSLPQIKGQIKSAQAIGAATGMGFQNAMQVGAAGAQAVQGTPWKASVGASMFQTGAAQAYAMASSNPRAAYAVERVGGVAQAGATIATAQMNMMQSGIGTRMAAFAMNPDGSINNERLQSMLSGKQSAFNVVMGANNTGFRMGTNRVRFQMFKEDLWNSLSDQERTQSFKTGFDLWRKGRGGGVENQAYAFAGLYAQDSNQKRLLYQSLLGPSPFARMGAEASAQNFLNASASMSRAPNVSGIARGFYAAGGAVNKYVGGVTEGVFSGLDYGVGAAGALAGSAGNVTRRLTNTALSIIGIGDQYGAIRGNQYFGDTERAARIATGTIIPGDLKNQINALRIKTGGFKDVSSLQSGPMVETGIPFAKILAEKSPAEIQGALKQAMTMMVHGKSSRLSEATDVMRVYGIDPNTKIDPFKLSQAIFIGTAQAKEAATQKFAKIQKDYTESGLFADPKFQDELMKGQRALSIRDKDVSALATLQKAGVNDKVKDYLLAFDNSKRAAQIQVINPLMFDAEGMKAKALRSASSEEARVRRAEQDAESRKLGFNFDGMNNIVRDVSKLGNIVIKGMSPEQAAIARIPSGMIRSVERWSAKYNDKKFQEGADLLMSADAERTAALMENREENLSPAQKKATKKWADNPRMKKYINDLKDVDAASGSNVLGAIANMHANLSGSSKTWTAADLAQALSGPKSEGFNRFVSLYAKQSGEKEDIVKGWWNESSGDGATAFLSALSGGAAKATKQTLSERMAVLSSKFSDLNDRRSARLAMKDSTEKTSKLQELDKEEKALDTQMKAIQMEQGVVGAQGSSGGNTASVSTPILNYWNNRWVL